MLAVTIPFILSIDWMMNTEIEGKINGIRWTILRQLDSLDFADDLALLSHSHRQMQSKVAELTGADFSTGRVDSQQKENEDPETHCYL